MQTTYSETVVYGSIAVFFYSAEEDTIIKVEFEKMYESEDKHHVNRVIETKTRSEGPDQPIPDAHTLYVVAEEDAEYRISLELDVQPAALRDQVYYRVTDAGGSEITSGAMPSDPAVAAQITFPGNFAGTYNLNYGFDFDGNSQLDPSEYSPQPDPEHPLKIRAISTGEWASRWIELVGLQAAGTIFADIGAPLLKIFLDCGPGTLAAEDQPVFPVTYEKFNCFTDPYANWLMHNAGLRFNDDGESTAYIAHYTWDENYAHSEDIPKSPEMKGRVKAIYDAHLTDMQTYFADPAVAVGDLHTFGYWSESGVSGLETEFEFTEGSDLPVAFARVRVDSHSILVRGRKTGSGTWDVEWIVSGGSISDLYDFNILQDWPADVAATVQLGYGNTSVRYKGEIYKDTFLWDYLFSDPAEVDSILNP